MGSLSKSVDMRRIDRKDNDEEINIVKSGGIIMNVYNIYFSPTGGTKKASDLVCQTLFQGQEVIQIDLSQPEEDFSKYRFESEDVCVIAMPSFGGRVPAVASRRLLELSADKTKTVLLAVYGNREFEDTLVEMEDMLSEKGFECVAAISAVAEHSIVRQYGTGRPDEADEAELEEFGEKIKKYLAEIKILDKEDCTAWIPGNRPYKKLGTVPMKPQTDDTCLKCGTCAAQCPVQAIPLQRPWETDEEKCISCMRCLSVCPVHARKLDSDRLAGLTERLKNVCSGRKENKLYLKYQ